MGKDKDRTIGTTALREDGSPALVDDIYELHEMLGKGAFGEVRRSVDKRSGRNVAVETIAILQLTGANGLLGGDTNGRKDVYREVKLLRDIQHENIDLPSLYHLHKSPTFPVWPLCITSLPYEMTGKRYW